MKLLLLKSLLQRRARDEGFTLPMVIALGLVMLLLGTINIVKSSEENISAISQNSSSDALAIAEVGVTKYRELLNQNRILTVYNHDQWNDADLDPNDNVSAQACNNMTTTPTGWKDGGISAAPNSTTKWWELKENIDGVAGNETIGEYRLVSYIYDIDNNPAVNNNNNFNISADVNANFPTVTSNDNDTDNDGESDAIGILTVQGRSPDGTSVAQIEVEIPLRINDLENFAPVLWVGSGAIATPGILNISNADDNIVLKSSGTGCATPAAIAGNSNIISDPRSLPTINTTPTDATKKNTIGAISTTSSRLLFPRPNATSDNKDDNGKFLYEVTTINVANNNNLLTDGTAKVALYASDDITVTGTAGNTLTLGNSNAARAGINPACLDSASPPQPRPYSNFYCASAISTSVSSQNLEIYVTGNKTININPNGGTVNIEAFIQAPDATLNITGSGTVNINGAVWVKSFNNSGSATVNIRSDKTDTTTASEPSYKFYTTSATMSPRPLTSTPTNWVREEVQ
jgi:hypothetical protein